jgi:hypothetical protein
MQFIQINIFINKRLLLTVEYNRAVDVLAVIYNAIFRECQYLKTDTDL